MSPAFIKGITTHLSCPTQDADGQQPATQGHQPQIVFDRYHVVAKANEAVDRVRRVEAKNRPELKRSRYAWLKNDANLTARQREQLTWLTRPSMRLQTARAAGAMTSTASTTSRHQSTPRHTCGAGVTARNARAWSR
jgi:predicted phage gp36 major capsid-like protein